MKSKKEEPLIAAKSALVELSTALKLPPNEQKRVSALGRKLGDAGAAEVVRKSYELAENFQGIDGAEYSKMFEELREMYNAHFSNMVLRKSPVEYSKISKAIFSSILDLPRINEVADSIVLLAEIVQDRANVPDEKRIRMERRTNCLRKVPAEERGL